MRGEIGSESIEGNVNGEIKFVLKIKVFVASVLLVSLSAPLRAPWMLLALG